MIRPTYDLMNDNELLTASIFSSEIFIFVEDNPSLYEKIFYRFFSNEPNIKNSLFFKDLSGCQNVIKLNEKHQISKNKKKEKVFFIIDLDFNFDKKFENSNFKYLNKYSIENYLLCKETIKKNFKDILRLDSSNSYILNDLEDFFDFEDLIKELILLQYINYKFDLGICMSKGKNLSRYLKSNKKIDFCPEKVNAIAEKIRFELLSRKNLNLDDEKLALKRELNNFSQNFLDIFNGKFIFDLLKIYLIEMNKNHNLNRSISNSTLNTEQLKGQIVDTMDLNDLLFLKTSFKNHFNI